jgi:hypothetical protein
MRLSNVAVMSQAEVDSVSEAADEIGTIAGLERLGVACGLAGWRLAAWRLGGLACPLAVGRWPLAVGGCVLAALLSLLSVAAFSAFAACRFLLLAMWRQGWRHAFRVNVHECIMADWVNG